MFNLRHSERIHSDALLASRLLDQDAFYPAFLDDLKKAKSDDLACKNRKIFAATVLV